MVKTIFRLFERTQKLPKTGITFLGKLYSCSGARAKKILGEDWQNRLDSFSQTRFSKAKYILCTNAELRSIMAFLTNVERKERVAK